MKMKISNYQMQKLYLIWTDDWIVLKPHQQFCFLGGRVRDNRDGHLLLEIEMYLQKGCIMASGVESS